MTLEGQNNNINKNERKISSEIVVNREDINNLDGFLKKIKINKFDEIKKDSNLVSDILEGLQNRLKESNLTTQDLLELGNLLNALKNSTEKPNKKVKKNNKLIENLLEEISRIEQSIQADKEKKKKEKQEYLSSVYDSSLFEKAEYEQAFDQCFLEEYNKNPSVSLDEKSTEGSFVNRIAKYSKVLFPDSENLRREAKFIIAGDGKDSDLQNLYPAGTKLVEVTAKIGGNDLYKHGDIYYTLNSQNPQTVDKVYSLQNGSYVKQEPANTDGLPKENHKKHAAVIAFGENDVLDKLRAERFQEELNKDGSNNELFNQANNIQLDTGNLDLSTFEQRGAGAFKLWLSGQETDKINANLPKIFGAVDQLDGKFLDALVDVILEKADTDEYLIQTAIDGIFEGGSFHKNRLGKTNESVSKNYQKLQNFIIKKGWLENGSEAEKEMAIKVFSLSSQLTKMTPPKTFQERIGEYAKVLFEHPVGKMILSLIDSMFGGKGNFLKWVSKRDKSGAIVNEINEQFKKNYSLTSEQIEFFDEKKGNFNDFDGENKININDGIQEYNEGLGNVIKNFYLTQSSGSSKMDLLATKLANQGSLLDPKVLLPFVGDDAVIKIQDVKGHPLKDVNGSHIVVNHNEVFVTDNQGGFNVNPNITANTLKKILQDARIQSAVINANNELIKQGQERKKSGEAKYDLTGNATPSGIQSEKDYAKFLTAYLMGGSKGEGKFQYVITENNLSNAFPPVENSKNGGVSQNETNKDETKDESKNYKG